MKLRLNISAGPKSVKRLRNTVGGKKGSSRTIYLSPSRPGEYPRKRTGFGQANVLYEPTSMAAVAAEGRIRVGYGKNAGYMAHLELNMQRKGLVAALGELQPQLKALLG